MIILVSSKITQKNIHASLGKPEYSYFFLMKDFLPVLESIGTVIQIQSLEEVEDLYARFSAQGEKVVFISVSPPHQTPLSNSCPTVCLFAWEFNSLPNLAWDADPQNDWRYVFSHIQGVICTSRETAQLVGEVTEDGFPIVSLPAPVWNRYAHLGSGDGNPVALCERNFEFAGVVIDSPLLGLSADGLVRKPESVPVESQDPIADTSDAALIEGPEVGVIPVKNSMIKLKIAWQLSRALASGWWREIRHAEPISEELVAKERQHKAEVEQVAGAPLEELYRPQSISVSGVVYCTVLNPADGRKNWVDIVTAFCWAFKYTEDATLIVKMTHHDIEYYRIVLITLLSRLAPFKCRVLVLHGFLEETQYQDLIGASTYYVNASNGEGLCLPLMEFLASGKPAIAPVHTAMADYVNKQLAFLLRTSLEPACWPHDPTGMLFTHKHRLDWQSLMEAFRHSYEDAQHRPEKYRSMSCAAYSRMRDFASIAQVAPPLESFLREVAASRSISLQEMPL